MGFYILYEVGFHLMWLLSKIKRVDANWEGDELDSIGKRCNLLLPRFYFLGVGFICFSPPRFKEIVKILLWWEFRLKFNTESWFLSEQKRTSFKSAEFHGCSEPKIWGVEVTIEYAYIQSLQHCPSQMLWNEWLKKKPESFGVFCRHPDPPTACFPLKLRTCEQ